MAKANEEALLTHSSKRIWYREENGVRRLSLFCYCDTCWESEWGDCKDGDRLLQSLEVHTNVPEGATYKYKGTTGTAQEIANEVFLDSGEMSTEYWLEMNCALRPGDSYAADEWLDNKELVTRLT